MPGPIFYLDRSTIKEGESEAVRRRIPELVEFIERSEPQLISYEFYVDDTTGQMTVVSLHLDSGSLRLHLEIGRSAFAKFASLIDLETIEVFGSLDDEVVDLLEDKAAMLGRAATVHVHERLDGFTRHGTPSASV